MVSGRFAYASCSNNALSDSSDGAGSGAITCDLGTAQLTAAKTFSGSEITTGPGRPDIATENALVMISGIRSAVSISTTHFEIGPKNAR